MLRRSSQGAGALRGSQRLQALDITLDRTARRVWRGDTELTLTPKALTLLEYLMLHPQEVHTRERLLSALWGFDFASSSRAVDHRIPSCAGCSATPQETRASSRPRRAWVTCSFRGWWAHD